MAEAKENIVKLKNVRLAFPQLFEAKTVNGEGAPAYSASFIFGKDDKANIDAIQKATKAAAVGKWGAKADAMLKTLSASDKLPLHDGDNKAEYDGYEDNYFVSARSKIKPRVVDQKNEELTAADGLPYGGCFVNASVAIWPMDNQFGKRVCTTLRGVQFVRDGDAFSAGRPAGEDEFDEVEGDEGEEALA